MGRLLKGLIFDFDGLLVDTETARYHAWKEAIESHGVKLPLSLWLENIGLPREAFDPLEFLAQAAEKPIDRESVLRQKQRIFESKIQHELVRPGVWDYLNKARRRNLKLAVCSSSPRTWVTSNLARFQIGNSFDAVVTGSDVSKIKPDPELYRKALEVLRLPAESCIAFEDSPKGVQSARAAGIFCVGVTNPITAGSDLRDADILLSSLEKMPLEEVEKRFLSAV